jgi:hypothetical protein
MKYAHKFDPLKNTPPSFWEKDFFKVALQRLDTSKMSPLDVALYENALVRVKAEAEKAQQVLNEKVNKAKNEIVNDLKTEAVKKMLARGKVTIEEIAEDLEVSMDFIKSIEKSLKIREKRKNKPRIPKKSVARDTTV